MIASNSRPQSFIARERAARDLADARREDRFDVGNQLRRQVRAETLALTQVAALADTQWRKANAPVAAPRATGGGLVHPTRLEALAAFIASQGWSDDPREPVEPVPSLAETVESMTAESRKRLAAAEKAYAAHEAGQHD